MSEGGVEPGAVRLPRISASAAICGDELFCAAKSTCTALPKSQPIHLGLTQRQGA
jgi:hypothetical protein